MAIQVTCRECKTRFTVSDKFAGQKGPCPKCKKVIEIPKLEEQVQVHAPEQFGPKDSEGRSVLKPLESRATKLGAVQIVALAGAVVIAIAGAGGVRFAGVEADSTQMWVLLGVGAFLVAPVLSYAGYNVLRDSELEAYRGSELIMRIGISAIGFALLWVALPLVAFAVDEYSFVPILIAVAVMLAAGAGISAGCMEFDYLTGLLHYGFYLAFCLGLRWIAGVGVLPFPTES